MVLRMVYLVLKIRYRCALVSIPPRIVLLILYDLLVHDNGGGLVGHDGELESPRLFEAV